ncbi:high-potential iron-sulfur protein [Chitinimonas sp.]|uniref:high-potential iron-sulfur protein n=1 Tax=Chitinimonas sp. TaxID=1934313 RepID=UPI002F952449
MPSRRTFILRQLPAAALAGLVPLAFAAEEAGISEQDPAAKALNYRADASKLKPGELPGYQEGQTCGNCLYFKPRQGSKLGPCSALAEKLVHEAGWCSAYAMAI